jgi:hypothetical protein
VQVTVEDKLESWNKEKKEIFALARESSTDNLFFSLNLDLNLDLKEKPSFGRTITWFSS